MAFTCEVCGRPQTPGTKATKVVTEVRKVTYPPVREKYRDGGEGRIKKTPVGEEVVKELTACPSCASKKHEVLIVEDKVIYEDKDGSLDITVKSR